MVLSLQNELLQKRCQQQTAMAGRSDPTRMAILRKKFIDTAKTYIGVPYARKYHQPDCKPLVAAL